MSVFFRIQTKKSPNMDTFHAVTSKRNLPLPGISHYQNQVYIIQRSLKYGKKTKCV